MTDRASKRRARDRRRGVSTIVATVLLVAITVVLAAVLVLVVLKLEHGPSEQVPLGTAMAVGPASQFRGSAATSSFCSTSHYCYAVPVTVTGASVPLSALGFRVVESSGKVWTVQKNYAQLSLVGPSAKVIAYSQVSKNAGYAVPSWAHYGAGAKSTTAVAGGSQLVVEFGNPASSPFGKGLTLQVYGIGSYGGQVATTLS